ncbi:MAG TPA: hypothetical protein VLK82_21445 [Candidatus Tectomicrobia bacterium]|nr:hypothetical protein [Candidatus Tectomicrobia bacterium]
MPLSLLERVAQWRTLSEEIMAAIQEWRLQHPRATLQEIETAIDARIAELRARMIEDVALASAAADVRQTSPSERPVCPRCGTQVEPRGPRERQVTTHQGQTLRLRRSYVKCPTCQVGFFPLDEELALLPGQLTPRLQERVVRLGT